MSVPVPNSDDLRRMLSMMYSGLTVTEGSPVPVEDGKCVVAIYLCDDDTPIGAAVTDFPFAAYSGAALTRIPPGGAEDAAQSGDLSESILEIVGPSCDLFLDDPQGWIEIPRLTSAQRTRLHA